MMLKLDSKFKFSSHIAWQEEATNEVIYIYNIKSKRWFFMKEVSMYIWKAINNKKNLEGIMQYIQEIYEVDRKIIEDDICNCLEDLIREDLIEKL